MSGSFALLCSALLWMAQVHELPGVDLQLHTEVPVPGQHRAAVKPACLFDDLFRIFSWTLQTNICGFVFVSASATVPPLCVEGYVKWIGSRSFNANVLPECTSGTWAEREPIHTKGLR